MQLPVRALREVGLGHLRGQARHGLRAELAALGHDGRDALTDVVRRARRALAHGQEVPGPVEALIDRQEEGGEASRRDLVPEPRAQARHPCFLVGTPGLRRSGRQGPPVCFDGHGGMGRERRQEAVRGGGEARRQGRRRGYGGGWQPGCPAACLACRGPGRLGQKEGVEFAQPFAAREPPVAALDFLAQGRPHGTGIGATIARALGAPKGPEAFGPTAEREGLWAGTGASRGEVAEDLHGFSPGGRARRLQRDGEVGQQTGGKRAEGTRALHPQGNHLSGSASQPLVRVLELPRQALRGNLLQPRRTDRVRRPRVVEQHLAKRLEALEGVAAHDTVPFHHRIAVGLGAAVRGRHHRTIHIDALIEPVPGGLGEETDQDRRALRGREPAQAMRPGGPDMLGQGLWEVGLEPRQIKGEALRRLALSQCRAQPQERRLRGQAGRRLARVPGGVGRLLNLHAGSKVRGQRGRPARQPPDLELLAGQGALFPKHPMAGRVGGHEEGVGPEKRVGLGDAGGGRLQP